MISGKIVLTIVPSIITSEMAIEMKSKPIHRERDDAMVGFPQSGCSNAQERALQSLGRHGQHPVAGHSA
jgi:HEAT repeat protein